MLHPGLQPTATAAGGFAQHTFARKSDTPEGFSAMLGQLVRTVQRAQTTRHLQSYLGPLDHLIGAVVHLVTVDYY